MWWLLIFLALWMLVDEVNVKALVYSAHWNGKSREAVFHTNIISFTGGMEPFHLDFNWVGFLYVIKICHIAIHVAIFFQIILQHPKLRAHIFRQMEAQGREYNYYLVTCVLVKWIPSMWSHLKGCFQKQNKWFSSPQRAFSEMKHLQMSPGLNLISAPIVFFSLPLSWYTPTALQSTSCLLCFIQSQGHNLHWCGGVHLRYLCHVLHPCQLCPLPHPREGEQSQASAICQWSKPSCLLAGQFCLGHGKYLLHQASVSLPNLSPLLEVEFNFDMLFFYLVKSR